MSEATKSHFAMFRGAIALAWADHKLDDEEQKRILVYIEHNKQLSDTQSALLKQDLRQPIKLDDVWPDITDARDRAHLINIADVIFWEDGEMCHTEKEVYDKISAAHITTLDMDFIRDDMAVRRKELAANRKKYEKELDQLRGPLGRMLHYMETLVDKVL